MKETLFKRPLKFARGKRSEIHFGGKERVVDRPLPKAVKSRSLEGIYPKWSNFPKIVLSRPGGGGRGGGWKTKTKQQAHSTILTVPPDYAAASPCKVQATLARILRRAGPEAPHWAPLHTCLGRGRPLAVYLLQRLSPPRHPCCGDPLHPTTSRPASATLPAAGEPKAAALAPR